MGDVKIDFSRFKGFKFPAGKFVFAIVVLLWIASGIYIVNPDEQGVVRRFGEFNRLTENGIHYHWPFPFESVLTPKVTKIHRIEVGFKSVGRRLTTVQTRDMPDESLMLTGDENIVDVKFIVQYKIRDAVRFLFNLRAQHDTVKSAAEAVMREVVGHNKIDSVLTTGKLEIQNECRDDLQGVLERYESGIEVVAVQLQDVHPPKEVIDAFKDVASAREDKSRFINEADAYRNDLLPKARGQAAVLVNQAEAYKQAKIRQAKGEASRFLSVLKEYNKAKDVTRKRLYLETMEKILSNPELDKVVISDEALRSSVPYLPLNKQVKPSTNAGGNQ